MELLKKLLMHANEMYYRKLRVWMKKPPRKGICEACGRKGRTNMHHWRYAYKTSEVRKNPELAIDNTTELCYYCHRLADAIRRLYEEMERDPERVKKLFKLREEALNG